MKTELSPATLTVRTESHGGRQRRRTVCLEDSVVTEAAERTRRQAEAINSSGTQRLVRGRSCMHPIQELLQKLLFCL